MLNIGTSGIQTMLKMSVTLKGDSQFIVTYACKYTPNQDIYQDMIKN